MRKVFFDLAAGPIGLEAYDAKCFLYFVDYLRANGFEPVVIYTRKSHNITLNKLSKRKLRELGVRCIDISNSKPLIVLYYRFISRRIRNYGFFKNIFKNNKRLILDTSRQYVDYIVNRKKMFAEFDYAPFAFEALNNKENPFIFTKKEDRFAVEELRKMGVVGDYVCVHARDSAYYEQEKYKTVQRANSETPRNINFEDFLPACWYIKKSEMQALRMGAAQKPLGRELFDNHIIDYAGKYRSDFMDIWLIANCKFYLGSTSGLFAVACLFNKPVAIANVVPLLIGVPSGAGDIYLPNKIWHKERKKFLTYKEIAEDDIGLEGWELPDKYEKEGLENIASAPDEIVDLAREMDERVNGQCQYTDEDKYLQEKFRSVFKEHHGPYHTPARVGREFLRRNKDLFL